MGHAPTSASRWSGITAARLGGLRGLDVDDYDSAEAYLLFSHRPDEDTPPKNTRDGERAVGLPRHVCDIVDAYLAENPHRVHDEEGRRPLITSPDGRPSESSIRA